MAAGQAHVSGGMSGPPAHLATGRKATHLQAIVSFIRGSAHEVERPPMRMASRPAGAGARGDEAVREEPQQAASVLGAAMTWSSRVTIYNPYIRHTAPYHNPLRTNSVLPACLAQLEESISVSHVQPSIQPAA